MITFKTIPEIIDYRLIQFDIAVARMRTILEDTSYINRETNEYHQAVQNVLDAASEVWKVKEVAIKVIE